MNEARLPGAKNLGHLSRLDVLVDMLRVMRPEQLGELLTGVLDEITDRPQPGEQHQVPGIKLLPQLVCGHIQVDENSHHTPLFRGCRESASGVAACCGTQGEATRTSQQPDLRWLHELDARLAALVHPLAINIWILRAPYRALTPGPLR